MKVGTNSLFSRGAPSPPKPSTAHSAVKAAGKPKLTMEQQAVVASVKAGCDTVVDSVAGSGKTHTALAAAAESEDPGRTLYLAFNVHNAADLNRKMKAGEARTWNSLGKLILEQRGAVYVDPDKYANEAHRMLYGRLNWMARPLVKLCELWRNSNPSPTPNFTQLVQYMDEADISYKSGVVESLYPHLETLLSWGATNRTVIDQTDMLWMAAKVDNPRFGKQDPSLIIMDEAQDSNRIQLLLTEKIHEAGIPILAIGDSRQAIYQFRGSTGRSLSQIADILGKSCTRLNLTVTHRSPVESVRLAAKIVEQIRAAKGAKQGKVQLVQSIHEAKVEKGDLVLARTNAPLIGMAFALMNRGFRIRIKGRDYASKMSGIVSRLLESRPASMTEFRAGLSTYFSQHLRVLSELGPAGEKRIESLVEQEQCLRQFSEIPGISPEQIPHKIKDLFSTDNEGDTGDVTIGTIHRTKGLEARRVFITGASDLAARRKSPSGKDIYPSVQEFNLLYIALTRNLEELYMLGGVPPVLEGMVA